MCTGPRTQQPCSDRVSHATIIPDTTDEGVGIGEADTGDDGNEGDEGDEGHEGDEGDEIPEPATAPAADADAWHSARVG